MTRFSCEGLVRLPREAGLEVAGLADDASELFELVERAHPTSRSWNTWMPSVHTDEGLQAAKATAKRLFLSEYTVEKHVGNIFTTLRLPVPPDDHRRVLAVVAFLNAQ